MAHKIPFTKMHGAGNDYIYVNTLLYSIPDPNEASILWSAPHTGIGSDGLVLIGYPDSSEADYSMRIFNADGSEAMMCGNASRCIGKYLYEKGITDKTTIRLQTLSGIKVLQLHLTLNDDGTRNIVESVTVDMLAPQLHVAEQCSLPGNGGMDAPVTVGEQTFRGTFVSMGNPHFVIFVEDAETFDINKYGPLLERHETFPQRCNIEFAQVLPDGTVRTRVWERGSGITMACGTGACATAVAATLTGRAPHKSTIRMDGGCLDIDWRDDSHVYMTGPATFVFEGEVPLPPANNISKH